MLAVGVFLLLALEHSLRATISSSHNPSLRAHDYAPEHLSAHSIFNSIIFFRYAADLSRIVTHLVVSPSALKDPSDKLKAACHQCAHAAWSMTIVDSQWLKLCMQQRILRDPAPFQVSMSHEQPPASGILAEVHNLGATDENTLTSNNFTSSGACGCNLAEDQPRGGASSNNGAVRDPHSGCHTPTASLGPTQGTQVSSGSASPIDEWNGVCGGVPMSPMAMPCMRAINGSAHALGMTV
jgi:hypothetical protein